MDFGKYKNYLLVILALVLLYFLSNEFSQKKVVLIPTKIAQIPSQQTTEAKGILKLYYANWCGWSKKFLPTWDQLENKVKNVKFEKIDCEKNKGMCENVPGYPFLILEKNGKKVPYNGDRSYEDVVKFLNKN